MQSWHPHKGIWPVILSRNYLFEPSSFGNLCSPDKQNSHRQRKGASASCRFSEARRLRTIYSGLRPFPICVSRSIPRPAEELVESGQTPRTFAEFFEGEAVEQSGDVKGCSWVRRNRMPA